jgi:hypothetical protein
MRHIAQAIGLNAYQSSEMMAVPDPARQNTKTTHYNIQISIQFDSLTEDVLVMDLGYYRKVKWTVIEIEPYAQNITMEKEKNANRAWRLTICKVLCKEGTLPFQQSTFERREIWN